MVSTNSSWILVAGLGLLTGAAGGVLGALLVVDREPRVLESDPASGIEGSHFGTVGEDEYVNFSFTQRMLTVMGTNLD